MCVVRFSLVCVCDLMMPLSVPAYMRICDSIKRVIEGLDPGIVVVDILLNPGFDACYSLNRKFVMSSPNTLLDVARNAPTVVERVLVLPIVRSSLRTRSETAD